MEPDKTTQSPTEREQAILKMVIEDYIETATPVPSRRLKEKFHISWSPATIRKTLHALECTGLLNHIHTSSGRVPTDYGYRFYVDELMEEVKESKILKKQIMTDLSAVASSVEKLIQVTANCLAEVSTLFGFVLLESNRRARLEDLQLVPLSSGSVLLVLGFQSHQIRTVVLNPQVKVKESHIETVASVLKERLCGLTIENIQRTIGERLQDRSIYDSEIVQILIGNLEKYFSPLETQQVCTSQKDFLLKHPEFRESGRVASIVSALDNEETLISCLSGSARPNKTLTFIGRENPSRDFRNCSVISRPFSYGGAAGHLGIIGPTRLSYRDVFGLVETFSNVILKLFHG